MVKLVNHKTSINISGCFVSKNNILSLCYCDFSVTTHKMVLVSVTVTSNSFDLVMSDIQFSLKLYRQTIFVLGFHTLIKSTSQSSQQLLDGLP